MPTSSLSTLLSQFQSRYPMGCLYSELLTIHQGQYVVRAVVQLSGAILATAMASASEVEAAEDRAKSRALEAIGITAGAVAFTAAAPLPTFAPEDRSLIPAVSVDAAVFAPSESPLPPTEPIQTSEATKSLPYSTFHSTASSTVTNISETIVADGDSDSSEVPDFVELATDWSHDLASHNLTMDASVESPSSSVASPVSVAATEVDFSKTKPEAARLKADKSSKRKADPASAPRDLSDRSEEIMKIGIEMKRLGWSTEQGREYLKRTYGKRSRQELDEAELLDFLHYLETQPSPLQTPF